MARLPLQICELFKSSGSFKLRLVDYEEVAGSSLRKVRLCQDVLHASYGTDFALLVDVLELVDIIRLVDDPVSLLEMDKSILVKLRLLQI